MHQNKVHRHPSIIEQSLVFALHNSVAPPCLFFVEFVVIISESTSYATCPLSMGFFKTFHSICTVRSCKPRRGAFNKGGLQTDDRQILLLDLGYKFHGDSLCSGACFEPAWTLWFCWSHLCPMWVWKVWASRILDHCPSRPFLGCSFGASVLPSPSNVLLKRRLLNMTAARLCGKAAFTCICGTWSRCVEHDRSFRSVHRSGNRKARFTLTRTAEQWHACTKLWSIKSLYCTVPFSQCPMSWVLWEELNRV